MDHLNTIQCNDVGDKLNGLLLEPIKDKETYCDSFTGQEATHWEKVKGFDFSRAESEFDQVALLGEETVNTEGIDHISRLLEGDFLPESICEADDRTLITNTKEFPFRATCSLLISFSGNQYVGTGWLISPDTVATAGHCVYWHDLGGWADTIKVMPGRNGNQLPFGSEISNKFYSVSGWTKNKDPEYDYGAIKLPSGLLGREVGYFGFQNQPDFILNSSRLNNVGYPADKPAGTSWFNAGRATQVKPRFIYYMIDTYGGQSGSSVYIRTSGGSTISVGVHSYGGCPNKARRIDEQAYTNYKEWSGR